MNVVPILQIVEGYGQTECTAPVTLTVQGDHVPEHVGPPVACCKVKVSWDCHTRAYYFTVVINLVFFTHSLSAGFRLLPIAIVLITLMT